MKFDPLGRRLTKSFVVSQSNHEIQEQYHHRYLYAGENIVAIYNHVTDELLATLLHEEDSIDSPLSIHIHPQKPLIQEEQWHFDTLDETKQFLYNQSRIKRYYYHRDHQNSILALSDENAQIVEYYEYDIYGTITKSEKITQTLNPYRYTGREYDTDDLYYYRARYYDSTIGRFITPDPIGFLGGDTNFYRYAGNDPVNFIDDSGFSAHATGGAVNHSQQMLSKTTSGTNPTPPKPKPSNGGGSAQTNKGDGAKIIGTPPKPKEECCKKPVPPIAITPGSPDYYKNRYDSFITRHKPCANRTPPIYYMGNGKEDKGYGYKYCDRFLKETRPNLSPAGQKWLNETLKLLQIFMDKGLVNLNYTSTNNKRFTNKVTTIGLQAFYTGIECRNIDHKDFAFATHPDAYRPKDMKTLPCSDLLKISKTPDWKEWLDGATWEQANIMREKMGVWSTINNCSKAESGLRTDQIKEKAEDLLESIRSLFQ
jgi:RHS repeat-associated protein